MMTRPIFRIAGVIGEGDATAVAVGAFLAAHPGPVEVIVNSAGGSATEGGAILAELEAHGNVTARVRGIAASSASLLLCGARRVLIHRAAVWMAHSPWSLTIGDAPAHRRSAELLDKIEATDAAAYARASGHPVERIAAWLAEELWLDAEEAVALRFADGLEEEAEAAEEPAPHDYAVHSGAPAALHALAATRQWANAPLKVEV